MAFRKVNEERMTLAGALQAARSDGEHRTDHWIVPLSLMTRLRNEPIPAVAQAASQSTGRDKS